MKRLLIGIRMDLKLLGSHYKRLFLFMVQMVILCLAIGIAGSHILYANHVVEPFSLAIVDLEDSKWTHMIIDTINHMETVTELCSIQVLDKDEAKAKLKEGEVTAIITIPEHFVEDVMTGKNTPITLERRDSTLLEGAVISKLVSAGTKLLSASQAGIYTTLDAYETFGIDEGRSWDSLVQEINIIFVKEILGRSSMYVQEEVVSTRLISPLEHYILSGLIVMLLLSLMLSLDCVVMLNKKENLMRYRVSRMKASYLVSGKLLSLSIFMLGIETFILGSLAVLSKLFSLEMNWQLSWQGILGVFLVAISISGVGLLIGLIFGEKEAYSLFIFLIAIVMAFLSGGIIPHAYLPERISYLGYFTYNGYALKSLMPLLGASCQGVTYLGILALTMICVAVCIIILKKRGLEV